MRKWALAAAALAAAGGVCAAVVIRALSVEDPLPRTWQRGMNFTSYQPEALSQPTADSALVRLRATGTTHVAVVVNWYMETATSNAIEPDPLKTPSDASVEHAIRTATELGMTVMIKPHVDVRDGTFRGHIQPESPRSWFESYRTMVGRYADIAATEGAELFCVGTELTTMAERSDDFRDVIADVRSKFDGELTYGANLVDEAERVEFWDDLDVIGIDAYMPLQTAESEPTVDALVGAWGPYVDRIEDLHRSWDKPVVFTELGYESKLGAAATPNGASGATDQQAQADAYEAAFETWADVPWFRGIYWWDWSAEGLNEQTTDGSFRPAGKLAETVISGWNGAAGGGIDVPGVDLPEIDLPG